MTEFDYVAQRKMLSETRNYLNTIKTKHYEGKRNNEEKADVEKKVAKGRELSRTLTILRSTNKDLLEKLTVEDLEFKNRRLDYLSDRITENINRLFPTRGFRVKIECDLNRGMKAKLKLFTKLGKERLVHMSEGKFFQSLVSYSSSTSIIESTGTDKLYLDEAFAVSDPENLVEVSHLVGDLLGRMNQITMIEQTSVGYKNLPRREIHLKLDPITEEVLPATYEDYDVVQ